MGKKHSGPVCLSGSVSVSLSLSVSVSLSLSLSLSLSTESINIYWKSSSSPPLPSPSLQHEFSHSDLHHGQVNAVDGYGRAALHYAAERDVYCVEVLLQHGAQVNACDGNNDTPLHWAAHKNNVECVKMLLRHGAHVDAADYNQDTPLSWAARRGNLEVIQILLDYNADASHRNAKGYTPLMRAAAIVASGLETAVDDACLDLLIRASGQFDARNNSGELVSELARDNKVRETLLPLCSNPLRLSGLCRAKIRRCLGPCYMPNVVPRLPIPQQMHQFVMLNT